MLKASILWWIHRRDSPPRNIHVAAAASPRLVSAECPRRAASRNLRRVALRKKQNARQRLRRRKAARLLVRLRRRRAVRRRVAPPRGGLRVRARPQVPDARAAAAADDVCCVRRCTIRPNLHGRGLLREGIRPSVHLVRQLLAAVLAPLVVPGEGSHVAAASQFRTALACVQDGRSVSVDHRVHDPTRSTEYLRSARGVAATRRHGPSTRGVAATVLRTIQPAVSPRPSHGPSTRHPRRRRDASPRTLQVGVARTRPLGISASHPRRRRDSEYPRRTRGAATRKIRVAPAAPRLGRSTSHPWRRRDSEYPRRTRGVAATRLHGRSTSHPRRRRDSEDPRRTRGGAATRPHGLDIHVRSFVRSFDAAPRTPPW